MAKKAFRQIDQFWPGENPIFRFCGTFEKRENLLSKAWIKEHKENLLKKGNSVFILKLIPEQLEKMTILGEVNFDHKMIAGKRNTLIL